MRYMEEDIQNFSTTVIFRERPCISVTITKYINYERDEEGKTLNSFLKNFRLKVITEIGSR